MGNFHSPIIESGASLSEACNQFSKEMLDMFDRVALEKTLRQQSGQNIHGTILSSETNTRLSETEKKYEEDTERITNGKHTK